jgi:hypothetical protein
MITRFCAPKHDGTCLAHGGPVLSDGRSCPTHNVLFAVRLERMRQVEMYGLNDDLVDGTGPRAEWLQPVAAYPATVIEEMFRSDYNSHSVPSWLDLVREEVAEAFQESDPARLEEELVQVAALCVSWVEKLQAQR